MAEPETFMKMEAHDEQQTTAAESGGESQETAPPQPTLRSRLRDLRPEKDPMGAGTPQPPPERE